MSVVYKKKQFSVYTTKQVHVLKLTLVMANISIFQT